MAGRNHIFVLNHNGRLLLNECMPSVVACARDAEAACRVTVIDNESSDGSVEFVERTWPDVGILHMPNRGLVSFNDAVRQVDEPVVLLLNNDVKLAPGCVDHLSEPLEQHADGFLAAPFCWSFDGRVEGTCSELVFDRGLVRTQHPAGRAIGALCSPGYTASAGAVLAVHREKFLALGGFDPLFLPGRYEDLDLAFRGWLAGWKSYFVPQAVAYHRGRGTFGRLYGANASRELDIRNALLFVWKNLREPRHVALHMAYFAIRVLRALVTIDRPVLRGVMHAVRRLPQALTPPVAAVSRVRTERELFALLGP